MANGDSGDALHLLRAESPGVNVGKLVPRMRRSTTILYLIYIGLTVLMFVLLIFDMPFFDALTTAFATAGTGGFSIRNAGMSVYSPYSQTVITVFMILFSINFTLYYLLLIGKLRQALRSEEMWVFLGILAAVSLAVAVNILPLFSGFGEAFRHAIFTAASVMSTSGFAISDFNLWPWLSKTLLVVLMFVGACAGSTGGGIKIVRIVIGAKLARPGRAARHPPRSRSNASTSTASRSTRTPAAPFPRFCSCTRCSLCCFWSCSRWKGWISSQHFPPRRAALTTSAPVWSSSDRCPTIHASRLSARCCSLFPCSSAVWSSIRCFCCSSPPRGANNGTRLPFRSAAGNLSGKPGCR